MMTPEQEEEEHLHKVIQLLVKERNDIAHALANQASVVTSIADLVSRRGWQDSYSSILENAGAKILKSVEELHVPPRRVRDLVIPEDRRE